MTRNSKNISHPVTPSLGRLAASPNEHEFRRNRNGNEVCAVCSLRRLVARDGVALYRYVGGQLYREAPRCGIRIPEHAQAVLCAVRDSPDGLTAAQLVVILAPLSEEKIRATVSRLDAARHLGARGAVHAHLIYMLAPKGAAYLVQQELLAARKANPAPKGRPRKYAPGTAPKSYYKPTGRPVGRPCRRDEVAHAKALLDRMKSAKPVGRPRTFDDIEHERQRAYTRRWREAKARGESLPKRTIASLTPAERVARTERLRERQRVNTASWRRWRAVSALAARHLAASPPEGDVLSSYALEWLGRAA